MIYNYYNESRSGDTHNIIESSALIYAHLMKYISVKPILTSWIDTIFEQSRQLNNITNISYWRNVLYNPSKIKSIQRKAISIYTKDGNMNGESVFSIVYQDFPSIEMFKSIENLKKYMISKSDNNINIINYINRK